MTFDAEKAVARTYDYIVVGEGSAGCPLAATLSQHYSVLVLERGDSPYGDPDVEDFKRLFKLLGDPKDYPYVAEGFLSEDGVQLARGRVLGGGTAINGGFYSRASSEYVRKMKWDGKLVNESYEWVEKLNVFKTHKLFLGVLPSRTGFLKQELLLTMDIVWIIWKAPRSVLQFLTRMERDIQPQIFSTRSSPVCKSKKYCCSSQATATQPVISTGWV